MHGQFRWYELMTPDPAGAQRFYPAVTGWGIEDWDQSASDNPYRMWTVDGTPIAGLMQLTAHQRAVGAPPYWLPYVDVSSAADTIRKAVTLGGRVLFGPETVEQVGTFAALSDPQGATFAVLQPATPSPGFDGTPALGRVSWHELLTTDMDAAWRFYEQLFGWKQGESMDMGEAGRYQMYGQGGRPFGGMFNRSGRMEHVPPSWFLYVTVKDVQVARDAAVRGGAKIVLDVMEVPGGDHIAMFIDPQGACFAVHQPGAPKQSAAPRKSARKAAGRKTASAAKKRPRKSAKPSRRRSAKPAKRKAAARKATRRTTRKPTRRAPRKSAKRGRRRR